MLGHLLLILGLDIIAMVKAELQQYRERALLGLHFHPRMCEDRVISITSSSCILRVACLMRKNQSVRNDRHCQLLGRWKCLKQFLRFEGEFCACAQHGR